jgi:predicted amidohydrolase YtcJ
MKRILVRIFALSVGLLAAGAIVFAVWRITLRPPVSQAFTGGRVLTMNADDDMAQAVLLRRDRIVAVGSDEKILSMAGPGTVFHDLAGRTLVPGLIDAHGHFPGTAMFNANVDLASPPVGDLDNIAQGIERLAERAAATPDGEWVLGFRYDDTLLADLRHFTRHDLDRASTSHLVLVVHVSGHLAVANTMALDELGITADTPDPEGGIIRREADGRTPDGVLEETAARPMMKRFMKVSPLKGLAMLREAAHEYVAQGVTTAQSGLTPATLLAGMATSSKLGVIPLRVEAWPDEEAARLWLAGDLDLDNNNTGLFKAGPIKLVADGSIQGFTGYLSEPYHTPFNGDPDYRGYPHKPAEQLAELVTSIHVAGRQLAIHGNGDASIDDILDAVEAALLQRPDPDPRVILIHAQMARSDQLKRMKELGVTPSFFVAHTWYWGDRHYEIFMGPERAQRISPLREAADLGLRYTIHLDSPVVPMTPMLLLETAVRRVTSGGRVLGGGEQDGVDTGSDQRVTPREALRAMTIDAAWQIHAETERGSIEVGKLADLAVLSAGPDEVAPELIRDITVEMTIVGGRVVYEGARTR